MKVAENLSTSTLFNLHSDSARVLKTFSNVILNVKGEKRIFCLQDLRDMYVFVEWREESAIEYERIWTNVCAGLSV